MPWIRLEGFASMSVIAFEPMMCYRHPNGKHSRQLSGSGVWNLEFLRGSQDKEDLEPITGAACISCHKMVVGLEEHRMHRAKFQRRCLITARQIEPPVSQGVLKYPSTMCGDDSQVTMLVLGTVP